MAVPIGMVAGAFVGGAKSKAPVLGDIQQAGQAVGQAASNFVGGVVGAQTPQVEQLEYSGLPGITPGIGFHQMKPNVQRPVGWTAPPAGSLKRPRGGPPPVEQPQRYQRTSQGRLVRRVRYDVWRPGAKYLNVYRTNRWYHLHGGWPRPYRHRFGWWNRY